MKTLVHAALIGTALLSVGLFFLNLAHADTSEPESQNSFFVHGGFGISRGCRSCTSADNEYLTLGYRHYFKKGLWMSLPKKHLDSGWFVQGLVIRFNGGNLGSSHDGTYLGATAGYRTRGDIFPRVFRKWFVEGGIGIGYLDDPDGRDPDGKGLLTQHKQFNIFYGAGYRITEKTNIIFGGGHLSNGHQALNRGSSSSPNHGRDFGYLGAEVKIDWFK
jgi:hypothetical protein